jgi:glycosyltransferase involved in cell wall biosynthesis
VECSKFNEWNSYDKENMLNDSLVSVCIPVYNGEKYIGETIDSVLQQTYNNFELVIFDNCSTDDTPTIIKIYTQKDARIVYHKNEYNLGLGGNWNRSVLSVRGKYIKLLCADDVIEPEHLQTFVDVLDRHPKVSLVTSFEQLIGDLQTVRKLPHLPAIGELDGRLVQKHLLNFGNWVGSPSSVMFRRRDLYVGIFNPCYHWIIDMDMWIRLLSIGNIYVIPRILTHNRIHSQRASSVKNKDYFFIKEELMFLRSAFQFPEIYGRYTKIERESIYYRLLNRLIEEGFGKKDLQSIKEMIRIGQEYGRIRFFRLFIKSLFRKVVHRLIRNKLTRKLKKSLPAMDNFSLHDLFWRRQFGYRRDPKVFDAEWGTVQTSGVIKVSIDFLRAPIYTPTGLRLMLIEDTPHYHWLRCLIDGNDDTRSREKYREYIEDFFPEADTDAQLAKIMRLATSFRSDSNSDSLVTIATFPPTRGQGSELNVVIYDGVHRSAIAKALGHRFIQCRLVLDEVRNDDFAPNIFDGQDTGFK